MKKSSLKLYFATFLFTLTLASFTFAGDVQCPIDDPPPPPADGGTHLVSNGDDKALTGTDVSDAADTLIKGILEYLNIQTF